MRKILITISVVFLMSITPIAAWAGEDHHGGHGEGASDDMGHGSEMNHGKEDNHGRDMGHSNAMHSYKHKAMVDGIEVKFEVMSLASMNMKDPDGNTHHIMVKFSRHDMEHPMTGVVGKIKVIGPDKKDQTSPLKDYGGILAANFKFNENGNYGVICLFKKDDRKHTVKFWYPHKE